MLETVKFDKKTAKTIAHRGLSAFETENTLAAFIAAGNHDGYYGIETDVHKTLDGKFVIIHDDDLKRIAGLNYVVEQTNYDELKKVKLFECNSGVLDGDGTTLKENSRTDLYIPDLDEYINVCKKYGKVAVLEIKNHMEKEDIQNIVEIIDKCDYLKKTTFISFDIENLVALRKIYKQADIQFLSCKIDDLLEKMPIVEKYKMDLDLGYWILTEELVKSFKAKGIKINVWTPSKKEDAERLVNWGVDFITSNILE
ncbi:MAG: hypothetical protein J6Y43_06545 [Clostridia bacterium]|nr:hypothetical protein [Clostridia bacterium]